MSTSQRSCLPQLQSLEPQAGLHAQSCVACSTYGTHPDLSAPRLLSGIVCALVHSMHGASIAWHILPAAGVMQVPIIVFHPVFGKYLCLARDCCPNAHPLTKKLVETAKWYFMNEVDDFTPVMQNMSQKYLWVWLV